MAAVQKIDKEVKSLNKAVARLQSGKQSRNSRRRANRRRAQRRANNRRIRPQGQLRPVGSNMFRISLDATMTRWMNTLTNPFGSINGAQIPDSVVANTMVFKDFISVQQYPVLANATAVDGTDTVAGTSLGVAYWLIPGFAEINTFYNAQNDVTENDSDVPFYHVACAMIGSNGTLCSASSANEQYSFIPPVNEQTLFSTASPSSSLVDRMRIVSFGMRFWPVVKMITDSNTFGIANILAGEISMNAFFTDFWGGDAKPIVNSITNNPNFRSYDSTEGVTCRFNSIQGNGVPFYKMKTQTTYNNQENYVDDMIIPLIVITFTQSLAATTLGVESQTFTGLPNYVEAVCWLEGAPQQPTPLMPTRSPIDFGFSSAVATMLSSPNLFPTITQGHSFKKLSSKIGRFAKHAARFLEQASMLGSKTARIAHNVQEEFDDDED